jgi:hypothetical protein
MTPSAPGAPDEVPAHDIRQFLAEVHDANYVSYRTLDAARRDPDSAVVLSGDYGGTIFLTVPVRLVRCDMTALLTLVSDLDAVTWMSGDPTMATVAIERHPVGTGVTGGDGGGVVVDGVWVHPHRVPDEVRPQAVDVVLGRRERADGGLLQQLRERELSRKRQWRTANPGRKPIAWDFDISEPAVPFDYST